MERNKNIDFLLTRISEFDDERAFKQFFDMYSERLFYFSLSFIKNKPVSEEVVSDVFFKVWLHRKELVNIQNIKAYLFRATYNTTLNYLDEAKRKQAISLEDVVVNLGVDDICPETAMINKELKQLIEIAIEGLPPRCKLIYKMAKEENMKYKEIAEILDISVKTINQQLSIALNKIGEVLKGYLPGKKKNNQYLFLLFTI